jgi:hypothetical protein
MYELEFSDKEKAEKAREVFVRMLGYQAEHDIKVAGIGQSALAGLVELIRAANFRVENAPPDMDNNDRFRLFLSRTYVDPNDEGK